MVRSFLPVCPSPRNLVATTVAGILFAAVLLAVAVGPSSAAASRHPSHPSWSLPFLSRFSSSLSSSFRDYDPDVNRNFTELITSKGYPCETHEVETADGYILTVFRIPAGRDGRDGRNGNVNTHSKAGVRRPPVLLWHGLLDNSFTWIMNEADQSLGFILADRGYDVWMGNSRGNVYSTKHKTLSPDDKQFWQFSYDEQAMYDVPNTIDYILANTGATKVGYVGHSQGTLQAFAAFTLDPSLADRVSLFVATGPVVSAFHLTNDVLKALAALHVDTLINLLGVDRFLPSTDWLQKSLPVLCHLTPGLCENVLEAFCGRHQGSMNESRMDVMGAHEPGGTSVKNMVHWSQNVRVNQFQMFDYGDEGNMQNYNQPFPPIYDIKNRFPKSLPVAIFSGGKDELADPEDVKGLLALLPSDPVFFLEMPNYAHLDFVWDNDAYKEIYPQLIALIDKYTPA